MDIHYNIVPLLSSEPELLKGDVWLHQSSNKSIWFRIAGLNGWGGVHGLAGPLHSIQMESQLLDTLASLPAQVYSDVCPKTLDELENMEYHRPR